MNYEKIYNALIERARHRILDEYVEKHHIVPRCMGGIDDKENIVKLTPEEHFVAHQLLVKIYTDVPGLVYALARLSSGKSTVRNNKLYGWIKRILSTERSKAMLGHKIWVNRKHTKETKEKISRSLIDRSRINKIERSDKGKSNQLRSHAHSDESKKKISESKSGKSKERYKCRHCDKMAAAHLINRYHNSSCRMINSLTTTGP